MGREDTTGVIYIYMFLSESEINETNEKMTGKLLSKTRSLFEILSAMFNILEIQLLGKRSSPHQTSWEVLLLVKGSEGNVKFLLID